MTATSVVLRHVDDHVAMVVDGVAAISSATFFVISPASRPRLLGTPARPALARDADGTQMTCAACSSELACTFWMRSEHLLAPLEVCDDASFKAGG